MLGNLRFKYTQCSFIKKNASNRHKKGFKGQKSSKAYEAQKRITGYMFCDWGQRRTSGKSASSRYFSSLNVIVGVFTQNVNNSLNMRRAAGMLILTPNGRPSPPYTLDAFSLGLT